MTYRHGQVCVCTMGELNSPLFWGTRSSPGSDRSIQEQILIKGPQSSSTHPPLLP